MKIKDQDFDLSTFDNLSSQKVTVTKDGDAYEWSFSAPNQLLDPDNSLLDGEYSQNNWITLFNNMPEIFAPVHEIASRVSSLNFVLKRFDDDEIVWDNENFNRLFRQPNPANDFKKHIYQAVVYSIITGASIQFINKPAVRSADFNSVKTVTNVPTNEAKIDIDENTDFYTATDMKEFIKSISVKRKNGTQRDFDLENIIFIANFDLKSGNKINKFIPEISGARAAVRNLIPVYMARHQIYVKRGALGFIVSDKKDGSGTVALTPKEKKDAQREYNQSYGVTGQANIVPILSSPVSFIKTSASIQEMQPFDETEQDARSIYAVLRVPKHLCPTKTQSTFNNADADMRTFYLDVVVPKGQLFAQYYTNIFNIPGHYVDIDTSGVSFLQEDKKQLSETHRIDGEVYEKRFKHGVCTLNDWVVATGGEKSNDPLYDKRILEMDDTEIQRVSAILNINITQNGNTSEEV